MNLKYSQANEERNSLYTEKRYRKFIKFKMFVPNFGMKMLLWRSFGNFSPLKEWKIIIKLCPVYALLWLKSNYLRFIYSLTEGFLGRTVNYLTRVSNFVMIWSQSCRKLVEHLKPLIAFEIKIYSLRNLWIFPWSLKRSNP